MSEFCINCKYYQRKMCGYFNLGSCRRNVPPFPSTNDKNWCGEYAEGKPQVWKKKKGSNHFVLLTDAQWAAIYETKQRREKYVDQRKAVFGSAILNIPHPKPNVIFIKRLANLKHINKVMPSIDQFQ